MAAPLEGGANDPRPYGDGRQARAATEVRRESGNRLTLMVLCLASLIAVVDITIVSIALPAIRRDLGFSDSGVQWILNGYVLAFGGLLLLFGRVGDLWGRRRLFVAGLASFAVAGLIGGLAWEPWILVAPDVSKARQRRLSFPPPSPCLRPPSPRVRSATALSASMARWPPWGSSWHGRRRHHHRVPRL